VAYEFKAPSGFGSKMYATWSHKTLAELVDEIVWLTNELEIAEDTTAMAVVTMEEALSDRGLTDTCLICGEVIPEGRYHEHDIEGELEQETG